MITSYKKIMIKDKIFLCNEKENYLKQKQGKEKIEKNNEPFQNKEMDEN